METDFVLYDSRMGRLRGPVNGRTFMNKDEGQNLLVIGAPEHDADAYHLSGFLAPDAVIVSIAAGDGPIKVTPSSAQRRANMAFSERNP